MSSKHSYRYLVVQDAGIGERYVNLFHTLGEAQEHRKACAADTWPTSEPIEIPAVLSDLLTNDDAVDALGTVLTDIASAEFGYPPKEAA